MKFIQIRYDVFVNLNYVSSVKMGYADDCCYWVFTTTNNESLNSQEFKSTEEALEWIRNLY